MDKKNNTGVENSGNYNSGDLNSGHRNSGHYNSGDLNSGHRNSGDHNSGKHNSGKHNSGYYNSGNYNSGHYNSGYYNSGDHNSGHRNSGDYNSGYHNSGFFNTNEPNVRMFNKETNLKRDDISLPNYMYFNLTEWINIDDMTDAEKEEYPFCKTVGGYLKTLDYKEAWQKAWEGASNEEKEATLKLPNFDADLFFEITGIDVKTKKETIKVGGLEFDKAEVEERLKDLKPVSTKK